MKCCSRCKLDKPADEFGKGQNYCKTCQREYMSLYRRENKQRLIEYGRTHRTKANPEYQRMYNAMRRGSVKVRARQLANKAFAGDPRVTRCVDCGTERHVDKAHVDYGRPLVVVPLCRVHHKRFDSDDAYRARFVGLAICAS